MSVRLASKYKDNLIASPKKHIFSRLLDYFSLFVVTYLLFSIFYGIGSRFPAYKSIVSRITNQNRQIAEYIDSTHLERLNEDKSTLLSIDDGAIKYVEALCKTSAYVHDFTFPVKNDSGVFEEKEVNVEETFAYHTQDYELDSLSYYFKSFKKTDTSLNNYVYEEVDYREDIDSYLYLKIMKVDTTKYVEENDIDLLNKGNGVSRFVVLNKDQTNILLRFFKEDRLDTSLYDEIYLSFINAARFGIKDVENNSVTYKALFDTYQHIYQSLTAAVLLIYLVSYFIAFLLLLFLTRLFTKEWVTLGQKVMGLSMSSVDELEPTKGQLIAYNILNFVLFMTSSVIAFYFLGMVGVLSFKIIGGLTLFAVFIGLFMINLVSLVMPLCNRHRHDFVSFLTKIYVKDIKEFEGPIGSGETATTSENNNGTSY